MTVFGLPLLLDQLDRVLIFETMLGPCSDNVETIFGPTILPDHLEL